MTADSRPASGTREADQRSFQRGAIVSEVGVQAVKSVISGIHSSLAKPTASDIAMVLCTLSITIAVGSMLVGSSLAALATTAGLVMAFTVVLVASEQPLIRGIGGVLTVPVALLVTSPTMSAAVLAVTGSGLGLFTGLSIWAFVLAGFASGIRTWKSLGNGGVRRAWTGTLLTAVGVCIVLVLRLLPESDVRRHAQGVVVETGDTVGTTLVTATDSWAVVSFAGLFVATAFVSWWVLGYLPLDRLAPPDRRDTVSDGVGRVRFGCLVVAESAIVAMIAAFGVASVSDRFETVPVTSTALRTALPKPLGTTLAGLVTAPEIRLASLVVLVLAVGLALLEWGRRALGRGSTVVLARLLAPGVGGALSTLVLARALADAVVGTEFEAALDGVVPAPVLDLVGSFPAFALAATVLVLALVVLSTLLFSVLLLRWCRLLPARAIGAALAAGAVFTLAIGLAVVGSIEAAILTAAGALVLWDIGEYADGLRTELGHDAATTRAELVHIGSTVLTGTLVAGGTISLYRWVGTDVSVEPTVAAITVGTSVLTLMLVTWSLRA